ncbi:MAG: hypothetical protein A3I11_03650 [Elusimicrobia bacterium RIFCSPLOWO2_02_FULL_39_32]|nr:MAG: hypothetical protein A2034_05970 [Elusimicrobia bacterium GWA2_38_7]OGR79476.1 MAG: hypothetical protein A3B80_02220 [Elusimicrobia bacterium RIFCSPHIGHO2_02_FULL_39_36]OGR92803.1 MAG: hypothetical protein A3I11_03650 [Elusimicrobia bacterium RIFCSPLOWO2_02_FULL_39_32]OGR99587.1 MAG: hypothetical protein A3G85_01005 [Elusimicrobia bacterium RIFCSPLOWO2_12_FULL_39_28]
MIISRQTLKRFFTIFFLIIALGETGKNSLTFSQSPTTDPHWEELKRKIRYQIDHFPGVVGIYIKDLNRGWTIEVQAEKLFPSASLVKIPIMATLFQAEDQGLISLEDTLALKKKFKTSGSGSLKFKRIGTRYTLRALINKMITLSDNTATNMLTDLLGLSYYNSSFSQLGLKNTNFSRKIMDLNKRDQGIENYTTPKDMGLILEMIYNKKLKNSEEMLEILKDQKINDRLPVSIPSYWPVGHKTGLMRECCHDVGIVFAPSSTYIVCVLTQDIRRIRRAKSFISEIGHLTALYYGNNSMQTNLGVSEGTQMETEIPSFQPTELPSTENSKTGG